MACGPLSVPQPAGSTPRSSATGAGGYTSEDDVELCYWYCTQNAARGTPPTGRTCVVSSTSHAFVGLALSVARVGQLAASVAMCANARDGAAGR